MIIAVVFYVAMIVIFLVGSILIEKAKVGDE
jgi:hypothetical protein